MKQFTAAVVANRAIAESYFEMSFSWSAAAGAPLPGQFISVMSYGTTDLILRRPFAVSDLSGSAPGAGEGAAVAKMIYQRKGKATSMLAEKQPGELLDLIGPLGNSFPLPEADRRPVLVGGGVGLGPILYFGKWLSARGLHPIVILGFRSRAFIPALLGDYPFEPIIATDDGSAGRGGSAVDLLRSLPAAELERSVLYACGPNPMMAGCDAFARERGVRCWVSMEQIMGCGVGACMGCAIPIELESRYARVCTEGPVFDSTVVRWTSL